MTIKLCAREKDHAHVSVDHRKQFDECIQVCDDENHHDECQELSMTKINFFFYRGANTILARDKKNIADVF